jgi:hypothetical protein
MLHGSPLEPTAARDVEGGGGGRTSGGGAGLFPGINHDLVLSAREIMTHCDLVGVAACLASDPSGGSGQRQHLF